MDLVVKSPRIPKVGETVTGSSFFMIPGGKGANQAISAAKLGGNVLFLTKLGNDLYADKLLENFTKVNIDIKYIQKVNNVPTGTALISINENGNNSIIVIPGANGTLSPVDIDRAEIDIYEAGLIVAQLEIPLESVEYAAEIAHKNAIPFILDPAPAQPLSNQLLSLLTVIKPNEVEAEQLTGIEVNDKTTAYKAAKLLLKKGVQNVIITLGAKGAIYANNEGAEKYIEGIKIKAVDSTAAGDVFIGAFAVMLAEGKPYESAINFANAAAAISVTRYGALSSIPSKEDVEEFIKRQ